MERIPVFIYAADPLLAAGARNLLMDQPSILLMGPADVDRARVALVIADAADEASARVVKAIQRDGIPRVVLLATRFDESGVIAATAAGVTSFLRRADATPSRIAEVVREADVLGCTLPPGLLRRAAAARSALEAPADPLGCATPSSPGSGGGVATLAPPRLSAREAEILTMVAEGHDTTDIAEELSYSESTIKGVLAKVMTRFAARNRCHAVAIAVREGLI